MKILFLDYDGVVVCGGAGTRRRQRYYDSHAHERHDAYGSPWHPDAVLALTYIVEQVPDLLLVISASDRVMGLEYQRNRFRDRGYPGVVHDITNPVWVDGKVRGKYIQDYLRVLGAFYPVSSWSAPCWDEDRQNCPLTGYCIVDDDEDMLITQRRHFVKTHPEHGLTMAKAKRIVRILQQGTIYGV